MHVRIGVALALAGLCGNSLAGHGFEAGRTAMDFISPSAVAIADVSGDGKDDLLILAQELGSNDAARVHVLVQRPDGTLAPPLSYGFGATDDASPRMKVADLDADGDSDIVVAHEGGMAILRNDAAMSFSLRAWQGQFGPQSFGFADVDGDTHLDIVGVTRSEWADVVEVYFGDGAGAIRERAALDVEGTYEMAIGDVDNDQRPDLVFAHGNRILIYRHDGQAGYTAAPITIPANLGGSQMALGDFNDDGRLDIAASGGSESSAFLAIHHQHPDGSFRTRSLLEAAGTVNKLLVEDVDGDGRRDMVVAHLGQATAGLYLRRPRGFARESVYPAYGMSYDPLGTAIGDINGDGRKDIVMATYLSSVEYMLGRPSPIETDLSVSLGLDAGAAAIRLENLSAGTATDHINLVIDLQVRFGSFNLGPLPPDCYRDRLDTRRFRVTCQVEALAVGSNRTLVLPLVIGASAGNNQLSAVALASPGIFDGVPGNNRASKRLMIRPTAASGRRATLPAR